MPTTENGVPVVVPSTNQRQFLRTGVGHVAGDVQPVLEKPDQRTGERERLVFSPEGNGQNNRKEQLAEGAAVRFQSAAEQADNGMTGLMKQQIGVIDEEDEAALGIEQH